jgi:hypothetical protein
MWIKEDCAVEMDRLPAVLRNMCEEAEEADAREDAVEYFNTSMEIDFLSERCYDRGEIDWESLMTVWDRYCSAYCEVIEDDTPDASVLDDEEDEY